MRELDWTTTDLGPPNEWPQNLRTAVGLCLTSRFPIVIWWGPNRSVLYNDAYIPFLGETKHPRVLGHSGYECWEEIWPTIGPLLESVYATGEATWADDQLFFFARKLPCEEVHVRFTYGPIFTDDGSKVGGVFCPCTEITEEIVAARQLETLSKLGLQATVKASVTEACEEAARVLGSNPHDIPFAAIYLVDEDGRRAELKSVAGFAADQHPFPSEVIPSDEGDSWRIASVLRTRRKTETAKIQVGAGAWGDVIQQAIVLPIFRATQEQLSAILLLGVSARRPFDETYTAFFDLLAGQVSSAIANAASHEAERRRADLLAELDRAKTAFFSNISHEFRTPLTLMLGPLEEMLTREAKSLSVDRGDIEFVRRNGERLLRLVNTLLDFSRIEAGRMTARFQPTDLAVFTTDLASVFRSAIERAGLRLKVDCPPLDEPVYVDRSFWERIVLNLLSNALKFTFKGRITVSLRKSGARVELKVSDTGTGISREQLPQIFERFHRIQGARGRTHEGSGIGLATVYELAKLHGGTVRAQSSDRGSRFTVSIPLGRAHLPEDQVSEQSPRAVLTSRSNAFADEALGWLPEAETTSPEELFPTVVSSCARILVADDNADMREYMQRLLHAQYHVTLVRDGEAALAAARADSYDLIVADIMMPRLDGIGLLEELRRDERTRNIPVILLSARAGEEARIEGLAAGANDYFAKPFNARELRASIARRLEQSRENKDAVRMSEERFRRYFELGVVGMAFTSLEKGILEVNDEMCRILGYTREELLQKTWAEMTHPDDLAADVAHFERVMAGEIDAYSLEKRWVRKDGEIIDSIMSARCERRADGTIDYFVGLVLDITERKRAEERLRRSEAYLAQAERLSHTGSWALNLTTAELFWSEEHFRIVGLDSAAGAPGYPRAIKVIHPDDRSFVVEALERAMREKTEFETECRVVRPDGTVRFIRSLAQPVFNRAGEVSEYVGSIVDITEARRAEEKIAESARRFRVLAETLPQHVWIYDGNGAATYFNQRWLDYTGMAWEEARGNGGHDIVHPDDRPALEALWRQVSAEKKSFEAEVRLRKKSGEYRRFVVRGVPFFSGAREVLEWHGTNTDVEDRRRAKEELDNAQEELARVTRITAMGEMAAAIAHEINQPLGAIVNNSNYCLGLLGHPEAEKKKRAALRDIVADANRASTIIERIRGLTNGSRHPSTALNVADVLEEVINLCQRLLTEHQIKVKTAVSKGLPRVRADRVQIQQVLFNLVTNAIAAMSDTEDGVLSIRVGRGKLERHPAILVTVTDNGIGFDPGAAEKMFDAFYTTKKNGMGMGLRVSRSIAEKYGGHLTAKRNEGGGATFLFLLPADDFA